MLITPTAISVKHGQNNVYRLLEKSLKQSLISIGCAAHIINNSVQTTTDCLPTDVVSQRAIREDLSDIDPRSGMRDLWRRVGEVTKGRTSREPEGNLRAEDFNSHYAEISRDASYEPPHSRITVSTNRPITTELRIFHLGPSPPYS